VRHAHVLYAHTLALIGALSACGRRETTATPDPTPHAKEASVTQTDAKGACIWTFKEPIRDLRGTCRDDGLRSACTVRDGDEKAIFHEGRTCPSVGFGCLGNGIDAAWRETLADGGCPPGSALP
jgi:hypothetical protein